VTRMSSRVPSHEFYTDLDEKCRDVTRLLVEKHHEFLQHVVCRVCDDINRSCAHIDRLTIRFGSIELYHVKCRHNVFAHLEYKVSYGHECFVQSRITVGIGETLRKLVGVALLIESIHSFSSLVERRIEFYPRVANVVGTFQFKPELAISVDVVNDKLVNVEFKVSEFEEFVLNSRELFGVTAPNVLNVIEVWDTLQDVLNVGIDNITNVVSQGTRFTCEVLREDIQTITTFTNTLVKNYGSTYTVMLSGNSLIFVKNLSDFVKIYERFSNSKSYAKLNYLLCRVATLSKCINAFMYTTTKVESLVEEFKNLRTLLKLCA